MRILHTGDWHIGNYNGPETNGENARFLDICKCLDALTQQAQQEKPDFIIVAGDVFHQARVWSDRGLRESQTAIHYVRMLEKVAPVIIVRGTPNHDSEQQFKMLETAFSGDDSVHIFSEPGVLTVYGYHGQKIDVAALPGFDRGFYRAKHPGLDKEEENAVFTQALEQIIIGMKAQCSGEHPAVLVGHYTIPGCNTESGQTQFFAQFEPVVDPATLAAADFDLTCFGHIHRPQMLDGCNNAFYCGAISALNFNDEGQERGFYIHELGDGVVSKQFYPLPTREFKTIRLEDEDVAAINAGEDMTWLTDVEGKIVRILYNCTDEHNKALNKTILESKLYELGAFWVQEITPEKITVTVNKGALNDDDTPEDNLRTYLAEREVKDVDAGRIVERARPIIAEATEANMTRSTTGAFVPVEIAVKNYRNYREETFNFEPIRFCTINGKNGAGKSSLFMDAMCDCLFEETREGDIAGWISNNPDARSGSIKLTFRLGENLYRVTRTRMKSGKATLNLAEQVDGEWVDRSAEKMRDTQAEILNAIGMDSLTLKATALIMQDQYGLFLTADKEARMTILGNILGLGAYGDMESIAARRLTETNRGIRNVHEKAADIFAALPDDAALDEAEHQASAEIERLTTESNATRAKTDAMRLSLSVMEEAAKRVVKLNSQITALGAKRATAEASMTVQRGIIMSADAILAEADIIATGLKEYRKNLEREKDLLAAKGKYDSLTRQIDTLKANRIMEEMAAEELHKKKQAMRLAKLFPAQQAVEAEAELTKAHEKYVATKEIADRLAARRTEYTDAQRRVEAARAHLDGLSRRAKLLEENECPHAAEVRCSFLRDALEAKVDIKAAEAALTEALTSVPTDYTPEQEKATLAILRDLELDERKYSELAVVKTELAAAEERIADLDRQAEERRTKAAEMSVEIAQLE
ncbi:MAG: exonuclease subunit SbcD, partial [Oscillospiraceae bacterium]|nr:exonuclease subunit SbcD [Oscillospiraceae bacterium]